jgi:hypothetical protein
VIPPTVLAQALRTSAPFPGGVTFDLFCQAIAIATVTWLPTGVSLTGVTTGVIGAGTVTGTLAFTGTPALVLAAIGTSLTGQNVPALATVLSTGLTTGLVGLTYAGVSVGVATGADTSLVTRADVPTLAQVLRTTHTSLCAAQGGTGSVVPGFYEALASGIVSVIVTGATVPPTGVVAPTGPVGPGSSVGTSLSVPV